MADDTDWNSNLGGGFGSHRPEDEFFHGDGPADDSLTETWYWCFHVPEAAINCFAYCWVHPTLKIVSGGLLIYQGFKPHHLASELFEMRNFMSAAQVGDGRDIRLGSGLRVQALKPLEHLRLSFDDPQRGTRVDVEMTAKGVPIMRANNKHFEQVMHVTGELMLRGEAHKVDCLAVRDRSWGEPRPENHAPSPPYTWVTGVFGDALAFNVGAHDDPESAPEWLGRMAAPERIFKDGWVVRNGEQRRIVRATKRTQRDETFYRPLTHELEFEDAAGETYRIRGELIAQSMWSGWSNMNCHLGLVKWTWEDQVGYGDSQEVQWNDYVYLMNRGGAA